MSHTHTNITSPVFLWDLLHWLGRLCKITSWKMDEQYSQVWIFSVIQCWSLIKTAVKFDRVHSYLVLLPLFSFYPEEQCRNSEDMLKQWKVWKVTQCTCTQTHSRWCCSGSILVLLCQLPRRCWRLGNNLYHPAKHAVRNTDQHSKSQCQIKMSKELSN